MRSRPALITVAVLLLGLLAAAPAAAQTGNAPGAPGKASTWAPGDKDGFGTSKTRASKTWYTINNGALTEVFFPRIDTPATRDTVLVVSDGETFAEREDEATDSEVQLLRARSPIYRQINTAKSGKYRITKTYVTDPDRSAVLVDVTFESLDGNAYEVYVLHDVGLGLNANDDTGRTAGGGLVATDDVLSSAVLASSGFTKTSSGYLDRSDGFTDVRDDYTMDWSYTARERGNVVQMGATRLTGLAGGRRLTLSLGFGRGTGAALRNGQAALGRGFASARGEYSAGWRGYFRSLERVPDSAAASRDSYLASVMLLAAHEDKTFRGGFVAAPGRPWAWADELQHLPVYIAVWSRDLYEIATGLLAAGDRAAARRALDYLWNVQQAPDGSFPQNSRLDGEPVFTGLQLDEVAFPIVLAWQLGRTGPGDWDNVRRSADFLVENGPRTDQERWENIGGYSPATIAAEIAGLVTAADIARENGAAREGPPLPGDGRRVAGRPRALDAHDERAAVRRAVLPADHRQRGRQQRRADPDRRRRPADRPAPGGRPELPGDGAPRREVGRRPEHRLDARGDRPRARIPDRQRPLLVPLELRRLRREAQRGPVGARRPGVGRDQGPRLAAAHRRARRVRAGRRRGGAAVPGHDGQRGRGLWRSGDGRAGVGSHPAGRHRPALRAR